MDEVLGTGRAGEQEPQESRMPKGTRFSKTKYQDSEESAGYRKTITELLEWAQGERSHYRPVHPAPSRWLRLVSRLPLRQSGAGSHINCFYSENSLRNKNSTKPRINIKLQKQYE